MKTHEPTPHILIVGSAESLTIGCRDICNKLGWRHSEQISREAVTCARGKGSFDLIVTDLEFPQADALELLRDLRSDRPHVPILVVPRHSTPEKSSELLREGATEVLFSPGDPQALQDALRRDVSLHGGSLPGLFVHAKYSIVTLSLKTTDIVGRKIPLCLAADLEASGRITKKTRRKLELAFQEAIANSLEHGNLELDSHWRELIDAAGADKYSAVKKQRLSDPYYNNRKLVISFEYCDDIFTIRVRDEGPGFSPPPSDLLKQKTSILSCSGRGIAIISQSVDELSYSHGGREICMSKRVSCRASHGRGV